MYLASLRLVDFKSFQDSGAITLSPGINVITGANNSGKSSILRAATIIQTGVEDDRQIRKGANLYRIILQFGGNQSEVLRDQIAEVVKTNGSCDAYVEFPSTNHALLVVANGSKFGGCIFSRLQPDNLFFNFWHNRRSHDFNTQIGKNYAAVSDTVIPNLSAILDVLREPTHYCYGKFNELCELIIGYPIGTFPADAGKKAGLVTGHMDGIDLDSMGNGVAHLVGFIATLCVAEGKVFIIEEIENDLHPEALRLLLSLIIEKSSSNQFIISTHSNIVLRHLGVANDAKIFSVSMKIEEGIPLSKINEVQNDAEERRTLLESLGYELMDLNLWKGWLFLEESSAEKFIRMYLIPWFSPCLTGTLRTIAAGGVNDLGPRIADFERLMLFTHLEPMYLGRTWVIADGDPAGIDVINTIKQKFPAWKDRLWNLPQTDFENYYPHRFASKAKEALGQSDKKRKQEAKKALLHEVEAWIQSEPDLARVEFEDSAKDVISMLHLIEAELCD